MAPSTANQASKEDGAPASGPAGGRLRACSATFHPSTTKLEASSTGTLEACATDVAQASCLLVLAASCRQFCLFKQALSSNQANQTHAEGVANGVGQASRLSPSLCRCFTRRWLFKDNRIRPEKPFQTMPETGATPVLQAQLRPNRPDSPPRTIRRARKALATAPGRKKRVQHLELQPPCSVRRKSRA